MYSIFSVFLPPCNFFFSGGGGYIERRKKGKIEYMEKNDWSTEISQLEEFFVSAQIVIPSLIHILRLQKTTTATSISSRSLSVN